MDERERDPEDERAPEQDNPKTAPRGEAVSGFPEPPGPGDQDQPADEGRDPHHDLNNPVRDPDPTEWPDPYEKRPDPRAPETVDTPAMPADAEAQAEAEETSGSPSTSEPHPERDPDRERLEGSDAKGAHSPDTYAVFQQRRSARRVMVEARAACGARLQSTD